jgi:HK97 family phage portal protein
MGVLFNMMAEKRSFGEIVSLRNPPDWYVEMTGGGPTTSGIAVNEKIALSMTTVYSCVKIISNTFAMVPIHLNRELKPRGKERDIINPLYRLLHDKPNQEQTSFKWRQLMMVHRLLWGAGISEIERDANGYPIALWPIPPWRVQIKRTQGKAKQLYYEINLPDGIVTLFPWDVIVFSEMGVQSDKWLSPIGIHRETIGSAIAVKQYGAKIFGTGINPAGILSGLSFSNEETEESVRKKYSIPYQGLNGNSRLMLLEEGVKFERVGLPPEDSQYLETRRFDVSEIARIYNVPLYMLQDHEKQTSWGTGIEEQKDGFMTFTMLPIYIEAEQELKAKLLTDYSDRFFNFLIAGILRGTMKDRVEAYYRRWQMGSLSPDDIKELEDENPIPDGLGNIYMVPVNMQSIEFAKEKPESGNAFTISKKGENNNAA